MVKTYQLYYNDVTRAKCSSVATVIDTRAVRTPLLEAYWMATLPIEGGGLTAVLSPEFERKTGKRIANIHAAIERRHDIDIWMPPIARLAKDNNIWYSAERWHPGILPLASAAIYTAGIDVRVLSAPTYMLYSNFFWMKNMQWERFRSDWLQPVIEAMQHKMFETPCRHNSSSGHTRQQLFNATGFPHYTWKPFICERLIGTFAYQKKLKIGYY